MARASAQMFSDTDWAATIEAAHQFDIENRRPMSNWGRVSDEQTARLLTGAINHLLKAGLITSSTRASA